MKTYLILGYLFTITTLLWISVCSFMVLTIAVIGLLIDPGSVRTYPYYQVPARRKFYYRLLIVSTIALFSCLIINNKFFG